MRRTWVFRGHVCDQGGVFAWGIPTTATVDGWSGRPGSPDRAHPGHWLLYLDDLLAGLLPREAWVGPVTASGRQWRWRITITVEREGAEHDRRGDAAP